MDWVRQLKADAGQELLPTQVSDTQLEAKKVLRSPRVLKRGRGERETSENMSEDGHQDRSKKGVEGKRAREAGIVGKEGPLACGVPF